MKLVQFLRPLFLVALGLHALVLFLPTGDDEVVVIENVTLDELSPERPVPSLNPAVPAALPVPDPNVPTQAASSQATRAAAPVAARPATSARPTTRPAARSTATRSAKPRPPVNLSATSSNAASQGGSSESRQNANASSRQSSDQSPSDRPVPNLPSQEDTNSTSPDSNSASANPNASTAPPPSTGNTASVPVSVDTLLAKVTRDLPDSLRALAAKIDRSLTYNAENTDDASAQQARDAWQADMQRQASTGQIERMPLVEATEFIQIDYPIESSLITAGRSLRRCLTEDPKTAEVGVLFDAQGTVVDEPRLLRSTGYSALNEEIKALVLAYDDFSDDPSLAEPRDRASKAYSFEVEIFYDSELCITAEDLQA